MKTAARLKKEQRRERKEALRYIATPHSTCLVHPNFMFTARWQEDSLRKQIEKYDSLISEGRQEIVRSSEQVHSHK